MLAIFNTNSSVTSMLQHLQYGELIAFDHNLKSPDDYAEECYECLRKLLSSNYQVHLDGRLFEPYKAFSKTKEQASFFNEVIAEKKTATC
jgi:hypothetical protein